uniref:Chromosome 19 open reading frame 71 n=1 Tax=Anas zonorhyncha TaxID=75864 RepID=A0A8B9V9F5_9AVES
EQSLRLGAHRPWVPQSTLETDFPLPLYSDQYVTLRGPRQAPVLRQAVRWKTTPMGWDAAGQSWATGLSGWDAPGDPWYSLTRGIARHRWQRAHPGGDPGHLREVAWWDPIVPAAYPGPRTRWGAFLWQERPILGKEYVATRSQSPRALGGSPGYVPLLSSCRPPGTARDIHTWRLLQHQPSTRQ